MNAFEIEPAANRQLDEIYDYTADHWGDDQANRYIAGLFARLKEIAERRVPWRRIPASYDVDGYFGSYERHFLYWKVRDDGRIGVALILHVQMGQAPALRAISTSEAGHPTPPD